MRFRGHNVAVVGDLEKAFLQISLNPQDRDYVRFLWFKNIEDIDFENFSNNELVEYRLCRVLFGVTSSPFLLSATLIHHISKYDVKEVYGPEFVHKLLNSLHVDDLNSGSENIDKALEFYSKSKQCLKEGGFNLRKFKSNSPVLRELVHEKYPDDEMPYVENEKVLGVMWNQSDDKLIFNFNDVISRLPEIPTKRNVLKTIASIYDPLGIINPIVVQMKIFFQDLCLAKFEWDEKLSSDLLDRWNKITADLIAADDFTVDRLYAYYDENDPFVKIELHGFGDASKRAHGCCLYLRFEYASGKIKTGLVTSRSRINSVRKRSVPKLELQGALLMFELLSNAKNALSQIYEFTKIYDWTDSTAVFYWIKSNNKNKKRKAFVKDRVKKIRKIIKNLDIEVEIKLIESELNPGDISSRGSLASKLFGNYLWFYGPEFLSQSESMWPDKFIGIEKDPKLLLFMVSKEYGNDVIDLPSGDTCLLSDPACISSPDVSTLSVSNVIDVRQFSSLNKLLRVTAYVLRFVKKMRSISLKKNEDTSLLNNNNCLINKRVYPEETVIKGTGPEETVIKGTGPEETVIKGTGPEENVIKGTGPEENVIKGTGPEEHEIKDTGSEENVMLGHGAEEKFYVLKADDVNEAKQFWIKSLQKDIIKNKDYEQWKIQLNLFIDNDGLVRCKGRIGEAPLPYDTRYPIFLTKDCRFSELLIHQAHAAVGHNGCRDILTYLRRNYWIPKCRNFIRKLVQDCKLCKRFEGKPLAYPSSPDLPEFRVRDTHAFDCVGLDYAGPVYVKNIYGDSNKMFKAWIGLITYMRQFKSDLFRFSIELFK